VSEAKPSEPAGAASDREAGIPPSSERDQAGNAMSTGSGGMGAGVNQRNQIKMGPEEVDAFLHERHSMTMSTISGDGSIHSVAMWYGFLEGAVAFETKAKSQKVVNLRRDPRLTCLVETGETYDQLRGVTLIGSGEIVTEPDRIWELGVSVFERYNAPYTEEMKPFVEMMLNKRVVVKLNVDKTVTWDHRKLGMPPT
jgi:PPOX class probable F420-dependent enzyme